MGDSGPVAVILPGFDVIVYPVIPEPPSEEGGVKETEAEETAGVVNKDIGAPGTVMGVISAEGLEASLEPAPFLATTVKV